MLGCCVLVLCCGVLIALVMRDNQNIGSRWRAWRDRQTSKKRAIRLAGLDEEVVATGGLHVKGSLGSKSKSAPPNGCGPPATATELGHVGCKWAEE